MSTLDAPLEFPLGGGDSATPPAAYARMMLALLPPGRVWRLLSDGVLSKVLEACSYELTRIDARARSFLNEVIPSGAEELLAEYELELELDSTGTFEERRARVVARIVARQGYRPADFQTALAPLLGLDAEDIVVIERTRAAAIAMANDSEIYRFFIYRNPALPGAYFLSSAQELVDDIKPSHTVGHVIESINMLCDDPYSLCDRDILGV